VRARETGGGERERERERERDRETERERETQRETFPDPPAGNGSKNSKILAPIL
jgi:hypothetical protein